MGACLSHNPSTSRRTTKLEPAKDIADKSTSVFIDRPVPEDVTDKCELSSTNFDSFGSEEDVFFDAQPWLVPDDTDNEIFGMNGDLTPSRTPYSSSTSTRRSLSTTPTHTHEDITVGYNLTPTSERRRSLSELFNESDDDQEGYTKEFKPPRSSSSRHYFLEPYFLKQSNDTSINGSSVTNNILWQI